MLDLQLQARTLALSAISCNNWKYPQFDVTVIISDEVNFFSWNAIHTCSATHGSVEGRESGNFITSYKVMTLSPWRVETLVSKHVQLSMYE